MDVPVYNFNFTVIKIKQNLQNQQLDIEYNLPQEFVQEKIKTHMAVNCGTIQIYTETEITTNVAEMPWKWRT